MENSILGLPEQLAWVPTVENQGQNRPANKFVVAGMGGSALGAGLLKVANPYLDLLIHRDYGLPRLPDYFLHEALVVCVSYSGQTAETISAFDAAQAAGLKTAVIASGGQLLAKAQAAGVPYVVVPKPAADFQPRGAIGYLTRALAALMGDQALLETLSAVGKNLRPQTLEEAGQELAGRLAGKFPLVYASTVNWPLAYIWKITLNETGKTPAFASVLPEANHNELEGLTNGEGREAWYVLFLRDSADDPRLGQRFEALERLYHQRGLAGETIQFEGQAVWEKIFASWLLANWAAVSLARQRELDPAAVPGIEKFKASLG